jgi:uncharacterized protein (TIGR00730 family)
MNMEARNSFLLLPDVRYKSVAKNRLVKREKLALNKVKQELLHLLDRAQGDRNEDLVAEMIQTIIKLAADDADRGDLKILTRTLKELRYAFKVFAPYRSVRKVAIFGSTRAEEGTPYYQMAFQLGRRLAEEGFMVITGAGPGIMQAGHEGAGRKMSFGTNIQLPLAQRPNPVIEGDPKLMTFHFFFTRKLMFVKEADAAIFCPGGFGTHDEASEAITLAQMGKSSIVPILMVDLPKAGYWRDWQTFVHDRMLKQGFVDKHDLSLFRIVENVEAAIQEIKTFYSNFHSYRFVGENLVIRLIHPPTPSLVTRLNRDFRDILDGGNIRETAALPEEAEETETLSFHRLLVPFNRRNFGRLRQMIDVINGQT